MLSKSEISVLRTLQREEEKITISRLSKKVGLRLPWVSELVSSLREMGFVEVERRKKEKLVYFASTKRAELMEEVLGKFDYMDFTGLLSGSALGVLFALDRERSVKDIAYALGVYRASTHRILRRLMERGVVKKRDARYSLNPDFAKLNEIAKETVYFLHRKKAQELSPGATIVWWGFQEFIIKAPVAKEIGGVHPTGPSKLGDYGVPLLVSRANYYLYSKRMERIDLYDVVVHTLLIEPKSTRYITYLLIVLAKKEVDEKSLVERAEDYGVAEAARALLNFLKTKGKVRGEHFPTWGEFREKALSYGVEI